MDCIFCAIVADDVPSSRVYEDERVIAFMDIRPATPGHVLVVPKAHAADLGELDPIDAERMMTVAQAIARGLRKSTIPSDGINLFLSDGEVAGQEVLHSHLHVVPRTPGDGFVVRANYHAPDRAELDALANALRAAL